MGVVHRAHDPEGRRDVALKVIKPGMDSHQILARFDAEKNALSLMDHPNIARVYDSGQTENGRPYFVLEYVDGTPVHEFCRRERLTLSARLRLFQDICAGVQHAHQKSVVHRDLKPRNVLITWLDGKPTPKIIDFGLAKALGARLTDMSMVSLQRQIVGTLEYMSPEQASGGDVDTRTDVYALGVILHELLVERRPFDLRDRAEDEALRIIREEEPPRPSLRVSNDEATRLTQSLGLEVGQLRSRLQGELDWIVLKALDKQRDRRYATPIELAADIERYLGGSEPIIARPPSAIYKLRKFSRKYRAALIAAGLVFAALIAGMSWALVERRRADTKAAQASTALEGEKEARAAAQSQRGLAETRLVAITRLSDIERLDRAVEQWKKLGPAQPDRIEAMVTWLAEYARPLEERLPEHRAALSRLRDQALDPDAAQQLYDRETHPRRKELARLKAELEDALREAADSSGGHRDDSQDASQPDIVDEYEELTGEYLSDYSWSVPRLVKARVEKFTTEIAALEEAISTRRTWRFAETDQQWQHDKLADLVRNLEIFTDPDPGVGTIANVQRRIERARRIEARSVTGSDAAAAWARALAEIRASDQYGAKAKRLTAQMGLFPLGADPLSGYQEFLHVQTHAGEMPRRDADGRIPLSRETGVIVVLIPGGSFSMGTQHADPEEPNYDPDRKGLPSPVHAVTLDPFFISKYEMTQGQWERLTGLNPSRYPQRRASSQINVEWTNPVERVSWDDCSLYFSLVGLVLPTEAQWEYAARAGTDTPWWCGRESESIGRTRAGNLSDRRSQTRDAPTSWGAEDRKDDWFVHAPVGRFAPNAFGLHDVIGNVAEWCQDGWASYRVDPAPGNGERSPRDECLPLPGQSPTAPEAVWSRMVRGGSFASLGADSRSALRDRYHPGHLDQRIGVRPARACD